MVTVWLIYNCCKVWRIYWEYLNFSTWLCFNCMDVQLGTLGTGNSLRIQSLSETLFNGCSEHVVFIRKNWNLSAQCGKTDLFERQNTAKLKNEMLYSYLRNICILIKGIPRNTLHIEHEENVFDSKFKENRQTTLSFTVWNISYPQLRM